jgi:acyl-CoA reductase-like NAD-dependent aldehyde dehydrogenase
MRDAMGVVVVLAPWNFPADEILLLSLPALMAGNCVVVKPSEVAPLTGQLVLGALASALPAGVLQVCQGDGAVGARLVGGGVDMVAMTGSSAVGKKLMAACAPDLKRLVLELGGKDAMVVFADADLDRAANDAVAFSLLNCGQVMLCCDVSRAGPEDVSAACASLKSLSFFRWSWPVCALSPLLQVCCSVERIYVDAAVKDDFEHRVVEAARAFAVGPGSDPASRVGPMVSAMQRDIVRRQVRLKKGESRASCVNTHRVDTVQNAAPAFKALHFSSPSSPLLSIFVALACRWLRQVADSVQRGARVLYQSPVPTGRVGEAGNWFPVTVLGGLTQDMPIQTDETFGPVVAIASFDGSEASAIALANDTEYGLAAYVYTTDMERAKRVGAAIRAGQVNTRA